MISPVKQATCGTVLAVILLSSGLALPGTPQASRKSAAADSSLEKMRSIAESQHEIFMLLLRKKEFSKAVDEAGKIFDMKWPADQEPLLRKELMSLSDQLVREGQPASGLLLLERNLKFFRSGENRVSILKEMGYLHKSLGHDDQALDCFRQARQLEAGNEPRQ
jgi:tetratricopeptide (TPR) repeat protein